MSAPVSASAQEMVQIVDRDNRKLGAVPRFLMRRQRLIHRASYILVYNQAGEIFVQQRTTTKDIYPGYWDVAAGGVVQADESYEQSAVRELAEELGVVGTPLVSLFDHYFEDAQNRVWGRIFRCYHEGPFILQAEEVADGRFMSPVVILQQSQEKSFTPDGLHILRRLMENYPGLQM